MYAFSTCWNSQRHTDGRAMLEEIRDLGFSHVELSHGTRLSLVAGILDAVAAGVVQVATVHNFCPLPVGVDRSAPNLYEFTSPDAREREMALKHTLRTFEFAQRIGARLVVLHLGSQSLKDYGGKLETLLERGEKGTAGYLKLLDQAKTRREARKEPFMKSLRESLQRLVPEAAKLGLKLGFENREAVHELPLESDFSALLETYPAATACYWHDCGHAQIKENLGFIQHEPFLASLSSRLAGFHVHDVRFPATDHCPPGSGNIDFAALRPHVKPEHIKVFELSPKLPVEAVRKGVAYLQSVWGLE